MELLKKLKLNPNNPRTIGKNEFERLKTKIKEFPEMLEKRPIVYDEEYIILGGNMRFRALQELSNTGFEIKETYFVNAKGWTEKQKKQFIINDNISEGSWDYDLLGNQWDDLPLKEWGIDRINFDKEPVGWNPDKTFDDEIGDGIPALVNYGLQSFWKNITNENAKVNDYIIDLPLQEKPNLVRQKYSKTNLEEIQRIILTYMRKGDYFLENCCGWCIFSTSAKYFGYSGVGVDIWDKALEHSKNQLSRIQNEAKVELHNMDGMNLDFKNETFDYVYCNPPFMDAEKYSGLENDIAQSNGEQFSNNFIKLMQENYRVLKKDKLCTITINDMRKGAVLIPLQAQVIQWGEKAGFKLHDFVIAEVYSQRIRLRKKDYEQRRTVKCHEYVITFKKS